MQPSMHVLHRVSTVSSPFNVNTQNITLSVYSYYLYCVPDLYSSALPCCFGFALQIASKFQKLPTGNKKHLLKHTRFLRMVPKQCMYCVSMKISQTIIILG